MNMVVRPDRLNPFHSVLKCFLIKTKIIFYICQKISIIRFMLWSNRCSFSFIQYNLMSLVSMYETEIEKKLSGRNSLCKIEIEKKLAEKCYTKKSLFRIRRISAIIFSPLMFLLEEVQDVFRFYKHCEKYSHWEKNMRSSESYLLMKRMRWKLFSMQKLKKWIELRKSCAARPVFKLYCNWHLFYIRKILSLKVFRSLKPLITAFLDFNFFLGLKISKFVRFPALDFHYNDTKLKFGNATSIWIGGLVLQIITTFTSAHSTFSVLIDRLIINQIKVYIILQIYNKV